MNERISTSLEKSSRTKRNLTIDSLRAIAALSVFAHHIGGGICGEMGSLGTAGVILFFLISGYCIVLSLKKTGTNPVRNFLIRRAFRLYPVYWAAVFLAAYATPETVSLHQLLGNLTMFQPALQIPHVNGVFWSLFLELIFYGLICCLLAKGLANNSRVYGGLFFILIMGAFSIVIIRTATGLPIPFGHLMFLSVFVLGCWAGIHSLANKKFNFYLPLSGYLVIIYIIAQLICKSGPQVNFTHNFFNYVWPLFIFFIAIDRKWFAWRGLAYIGKISFCIYLFHNPLLWLIEPWISSPFALFGVILIMTLILSSLAHHYIEMPFIRLGKRFLDKFGYVTSFA
ncbi:MAG: acyltransferase [Legionella sp.]|nr:acyltransferase [Legionella sp.]